MKLSGSVLPWFFFIPKWGVFVPLSIILFCSMGSKNVAWCHHRSHSTLPMPVTCAWHCTQMSCSDWCVTTECETQCSIWCNELTVYTCSILSLMALPVAYEYACLMVRGYKTAETKKTAHLANMRGRYLLVYVTEEKLPQTGHCDLVDALRQDGPKSVTCLWCWIHRVWA